MGDVAAGYLGAMGGIPDDKIQEVRDKVDIVDLVGRYVELRRSGRNYVGLCPFHQERSPSFNVNPARKGYKCFGCGVSGDSIAFVMEIEGSSFIETIQKLAQMYAVTLPAGVTRGRSGPDRNERDKAYAVTRAATDLYRHILLEAPEGEAGRAYLTARGVDSETAAAFSLGYAPAPDEAGWDRLAQALQEKQLSGSVAQTLGLLKASERRGSSVYDAFRGRLMFPVVQPGGEVIAFSGRIVPPHDTAHDGRPAPKYVNSSESFLYKKEKTLFGLSQARANIKAKGRAILVEGNLDVVRLHQRGFGETVAPLGTAVTDEQARLLARFTSQVVLCFDGDKAGRDAAGKAIPRLLAHDIDVRMVMLPDGEDPDSMDPEHFANLLADPRSALQVAMTRLAAWAGDSPDARARALDRTMTLIGMVRRPSARAFHAESAAALFNVPLDNLLGALQRNLPRAAGRDGGPVQPSASVRSLPPLPQAQAELTMLLVDVPHLATIAKRAGALEHVDDDRLRPILHAVIEGADDGHMATMPELLEHVPPVVQPQVLEHVFAGKYRADDDGPGLGDPQVELHTLIHRCREEALGARVLQLDLEYRQARESGDLELQRKLQQQRFDLRRQQANLRQSGPPPAQA